MLDNLLAPQIQTAMMTVKNADAAKAQALPKGMDEKRLDEAAKEFEAVFVSEMLKPMFEGLKPDPMFGGGKGEEVFQGILLQEYGKKIVEAGGIGLASSIKAEMIRMQEEANNGK